MNTECVVDDERLRALFASFHESKTDGLFDWHDRYTEFSSEVAKVRVALAEGADTRFRDEKFLKSLLKVRSNGIASRGQSVLSDVDFKRLIGDKTFMSSLRKFLENPDEEHYLTFQSQWKKRVKRLHRLLVNRVAAACTPDVSSTVDERRFRDLLKWLEVNKLVTNVSGSSWFSQNTCLMRGLHQLFDADIQSGKTDKFWVSQFVWHLHVMSQNPFRLKKQTVLYGVPGTGKTWRARQFARELLDAWCVRFGPGSDHAESTESYTTLVQFHPSFSYEDFIEGLKPTGEGEITLQNGVFKAFCRQAGRWELDYARENSLMSAVGWDALTVTELKASEVDTKAKHWQSIGIDRLDGNVRVADAVPPFCFIIDEINRAELSRVFGELMFCLEYRGVDGKIATQYAAMNTSDTGMHRNSDESYSFFVPHNVHVIGTMNTVDRSVDSIDFAMRRRFHWVEVKPDIALVRAHLEEMSKSWAKLASNLETLNEHIAGRDLLGLDYRIGHAYLMNLAYPQNLPIDAVRKAVWSDALQPLLQEYARGSGQEALILQEAAEKFGLNQA